MTYKVGQKVWMQSGPLRKEGTVISVVDNRVSVETFISEDARYGLHFRDGEQCCVLLYTGSCWDDYDHRLECTEFGPWELPTAPAPATTLV